MVFMCFLSAGIILSAIGISIYYALYRCFPWEKYMKAVKYYTCIDGIAERFTFTQQYEWHKSKRWRYDVYETTTNLTFKTFKTLFELNPNAWTIEESEFGDNDMYFQIIYKKDKANIKVVFNKKDFNKYRRWLANRRKNKYDRVLNMEKTRSIEACQKIIEGAKKDIQKTFEQAEQELQEAQNTMKQVNENLIKTNTPNPFGYDIYWDSEKGKCVMYHYGEAMKSHEVVD